MKSFHIIIPFPVFVFVGEDQTVEPLTEGALQASFWEVLPSYCPDMQSRDEPAMETLIIDPEGILIKSDSPSGKDNLKSPQSLVASVAAVGNKELEEQHIQPPLVSPRADTPLEISYRLITDITEAKEALDELVARQEIVGLDLETTGLFTCSLNECCVIDRSF